MDASDRIRRNQTARVAVATVPSFNASWTSGTSTVTWKSGATPLVGATLYSPGLPENTRITQVSGATLTITTTTTNTSTQNAVTMLSGSTFSLASYPSYETKYTVQQGLPNLTYASGVPVYASTIGVFGCPV